MTKPTPGPMAPMSEDEAEAFMKAEREKTASERAYFEAHRTEWLRLQAGRYALVKGRQSHGFFESFAAAYEEGERRFGANAPMLIKRIAPEDDVLSVSPGLLHGNLIVVE